MNSKHETSGRLTVGLSVLVLMALALVASELRSGAVEGAGQTRPDQVLFIEAGKG